MTLMEIKVQDLQDNAKGNNDAKSVENVSKLINWNINVKVMIPNSKIWKTFQRMQSLLFFVLAVIFAVILSSLKREVHALHVQMHCMNTNLMILMFKYDKLNRNLNRVWFHHSYNKFYQSNAMDAQQFIQRSLKSSFAEPSIEMPEKTNDFNLTSTQPYLQNIIVLSLNQRSNAEMKILPINNTDSANANYISDESSNDNDTDNYSNNKTVVRVERANLTFDKQSSIVDEQSWYKSNENEDDLNSWNEPRTGRSRRDDRRGKKRRKSEWRPKRSRRRLGILRRIFAVLLIEFTEIMSRHGRRYFAPIRIAYIFIQNCHCNGPLVVTFVGAVPEQHIIDTDYVGPWVKSTKNESQYSLNKFHLVENTRSIEVTTGGLYMVSTQIYYFGEHTHYSYWILLTSEGKSFTQKLVKCATVSTISATEVSCHTSTVLFLRKGDRLHIQQQERDRLINLREGYSYVQLVLLSSNDKSRRQAE